MEKGKQYSYQISNLAFKFSNQTFVSIKYIFLLNLYLPNGLLFQGSQSILTIFLPYGLVLAESQQQESNMKCNSPLYFCCFKVRGDNLGRKVFFPSFCFHLETSGVETSVEILSWPRIYTIQRIDVICVLQVEPELLVLLMVVLYGGGKYEGGKMLQKLHLKVSKDFRD